MRTFVIFAIMLGLDFYWFFRLKILFKKAENHLFKNIIFVGYWSLSVLMISFWLYFRWADVFVLPILLRSILSTSTIALYITKLFTALPFFIEDFIIFLKFCFYALKNVFFPKRETFPKTENHLTRSEFLVKSALWASSVPLGLLSYGMSWGATDFRVHTVNVKIPNLSKKWRGLRIGHISDIHVGSYFDDKAIRRGIELLKQQKPDIICFTGDLINQYTDEAKQYFSALSTLKAPLGVVSCLGNHDYGDYFEWKSLAEKTKNLEKMYLLHKELGWKLLVDETFFLEENNEKLAFLGVGNWSAFSRFPQYGNLSKTYQLAQNEAQNKILLSHDPSHWDAQIRDYKDINLTLSGHTHGMQLGIEIGNFKWSPSQYMYDQWAGLYEKNKQQIYVNRGFGYSQVLPARIGILPEITILNIV